MDPIIFRRPWPASAVPPRMAKKLIRRTELDHCHPSWFLVGNRPTAQATMDGRSS
jgi:hypothetical protein